MRNSISRFFAPVLLAALAALQTQANARLSSLFTDNMVLQRGKEVPVWGWAAPGEEVAVTFAGQTAKATAGADGKWLARLAPLAASAEGRVLSVAGKNRLELKNVVVGDVWLFLGRGILLSPAVAVLDWTGKNETAKHPEIRQMSVKLPLNGMDIPFREPNTDGWQVVGPANVANIQAVGYCFARAVSGKTHAPVGLITALHWLGTMAAWMPPEAFKLRPELHDAAAQLAQFDVAGEAGNKAYREALAKVKAWLPEAERAVKEKRCPFPAPQLPSLSRNANAPCKFHNAGVKPLMPFALRGCVVNLGGWADGANRDFPPKFQALVESWRAVWGADLQICYLQAAADPYSHPKAFEDGKGFMWLRDDQRRCLDIPNCGMAVTFDLSSDNRQDLRDCADRLARVVFEGGSGPLFKSMTAKDGRIQVSFTQVGSGLQAGRTPGGRLEGFAVVGKDGVWHEAEAEIVGDTVVASSPEVKEPLALRYGWAPTPRCNLYNREGLPASPFSTNKR